MILIRHSSGTEVVTEDPAGYDLAEWTIVGELGAIPPELAKAGESGVVANLELARALKISELQAERNTRQSAGCDTALGTMQTDPTSRGLLNGAVTGALVAQAAGQPFSVGWTMADNSVVEHDGPAIIAAGMIVMAHVQQQHAIYETLRADVQAATDLAAIDAVQWPET